jgi:hypothetical protein
MSIACDVTSRKSMTCFDELQLSLHVEIKFHAVRILFCMARAFGRPFGAGLRPLSSRINSGPVVNHMVCMPV